MNKQIHEIFKKFIIHCADIYVNDNDLTDDQIIVIDNFASEMLNQLDILTDLLKIKKGI